MKERESGDRERALAEVLERYATLAPGEQLLTPELVEALPPMKSQRNEEYPILQARFFHAVYQWDWCPIEFDPDTLTFWGFVNGNGPEFGYFPLEHLENDFVCPAGILTPERDLTFQPTRFTVEQFCRF